MNINALFAEQANIVAYAPLDMSGAAGLQTPYVSLKNYARATVVLLCAAGGAETPALTFQQSKNVAGLAVKPLTTIVKIHKKEHATTLETQGIWTAVEQAPASIFSATQAVQALYAIDVKAEDLDNENDFDCFRVTIADVGVAVKLGALFVALWGARFVPPLTPLSD